MSLLVKNEEGKYQVKSSGIEVTEEAEKDMFNFYKEVEDVIRDHKLSKRYHDLYKLGEELYNAYWGRPAKQLITLTNEDEFLLSFLKFRYSANSVITLIENEDVCLNAVLGLKKGTLDLQLPTYKKIKSYSKTIFKPFTDYIASVYEEIFTSYSLLNYVIKGLTTIKDKRYEIFAKGVSRKETPAEMMYGDVMASRFTRSFVENFIDIPRSSVTLYHLMCFETARDFADKGSKVAIITKDEQTGKYQAESSGVAFTEESRNKVVAFLDEFEETYKKLGEHSATMEEIIRLGGEFKEQLNGKTTDHFINLTSDDELLYSFTNIIDTFNKLMMISDKATERKYTSLKSYKALDSFLAELGGKYLDFIREVNNAINSIYHFIDTPDSHMSTGFIPLDVVLMHDRNNERCLWHSIYVFDDFRKTLDKRLGA
jgi:hypothetical protein